MLLAGICKTKQKLKKWNIHVLTLFSGTSSDPGVMNRQFINELRILTTIQTENGADKKLSSVVCLNDDELWTCYTDHNTMIRYNLRGEQEAEEETSSGQKTYDITVLQGNLVYTVSNSRKINIIERETRVLGELLKVAQRWIPQGVCSTRSGGLLVIMKRDFIRETRVVRYTYMYNRDRRMQSIKTIQSDGQGPLYSFGYYKYLAENRNGDICVADSDANAVVVVNEDGNLRFRYTSHFSIDMGAFTPRAITTDSQANILTTDWVNHCVHIIDRDGQFLRFIDNCNLQRPYGLCVDSTDNLFVAEWSTRRVKKIQYYV